MLLFFRSTSCILSFVFVFISASESNLKFVDKAFDQLKFLLPEVEVNLGYRRLVALLSFFPNCV